MKRQYLFTLAALLLFAACKKDKDKIPEGEAYALYNGSDWNAQPIAYPSRFGRNDLFELALFVNKGKDDEQILSLGNVGLNMLKQRIWVGNSSNSQNPDTLWAFYYTSQAYDVTGDEYTIVASDSVNNWIRITSAEDNFTRNIRGEFSATFVRTKTFLHSPYPDTVRFRNGTFFISEIKQ